MSEPRPVTMDEARIAAWRSKVPRAFGRSTGERLRLWAGWSAFVLLTGYCLWRFEFSPLRLWRLGDLGLILRQLVPPSPGAAPLEIFQALLETIAMAFLGTLMAALISVSIAFLAARNTFPFALPRFGVRRLLDGLRGIDQLIWALIFVRARQAVRRIDREHRKEADRGRALGGRRQHPDAALGVLPQVLPMFLSSTLYLFESNVRSATILGIVGAGGIGFQLSDRIRAHAWEEASFILIVILVAVACIDTASKAIRTRTIGGNRPPPH